MSESHYRSRADAMSLGGVIPFMRVLQFRYDESACEMMAGGLKAQSKASDDGSKSLLVELV